MADVAATNPGMDRYNRYYTAVLQQLQADQGPERSDSQLKNYLTRMIRPTYEQAIAQRQQQTGQANAMIDTDAAGRGMGTSTWVTDAKNRQRNNEAQDIANLNSNYNSTLYDSLLGLINQRDQNRLALMGQAQSIAGSMYDRWKAEDDALAARSAGGGGGGGGGGSSPGRRYNPPPTETPPGDEFGNELLIDPENIMPNLGASSLQRETKNPGTTYTPVTNSNKNSAAYHGNAYNPAAYRSATPVAGTSSAGASRSYDDKINGKLVTPTKAPGTVSSLGLTVEKKKVK